MLNVTGDLLAAGTVLTWQSVGVEEALAGGAPPGGCVQRAALSMCSTGFCMLQVGRRVSTARVEVTGQ